MNHIDSLDQSLGYFGERVYELKIQNDDLYYK